MPNLNTNLTKETIQKSKKLQDINCNTQRLIISFDKNKTKEIISYNYNFEYNPDDGEKIKNAYPAPTIADVISNAEYLFSGNKGIKIKYHIIAHEILDMCFLNKPLKEIEKYIIKNLKVY